MLEALKPFSKAIASSLSAIIVGYLYKHNIIIADNLPDALEVLIGAVIVGGVTYFAPKNKPVNKG